uniref:Uncharacterized protein n=1 Tax=Arundo donax TaxID=35708 RepID=A0A0A9F546_ARUDO
MECMSTIHHRAKFLPSAVPASLDERGITNGKCKTNSTFLKRYFRNRLFCFKIFTLITN